MRFEKFLACAVLALCAGPAASAVMVIGSSSARLCYEAARSTMPAARSALETCNRAFEEEALSEHDAVATFVNRGILHMRRGSLDTAIADFDSAIARDPKEPEAYLNKGAALIRVPGSARAAIPLFTAALERNTRKPALAYFGRGIAHEEIGDVKAAYYDYKSASAADPGWQQPIAELARFTVRGN